MKEIKISKKKSSVRITRNLRIDGRRCRVREE